MILKDNFHVGILEILRGHTKLITTLTSFPLSPSCITCVTCNKNHIYNILEGKNARARSLTKLWVVNSISLKATVYIVILVTSKYNSKSLVFLRIARFPLIGSRLLVSGTKYLTLKWRAFVSHTHTHNRIVFADVLRFNQIAENIPTAKNTHVVLF